MIFSPFLITFLWCNSVLAREIWRHQVDVNTDEQNNKVSRASTQITSIIMARRSQRKQRQIRMFKVILVLMTVFLMCRLPHWIYILYKLKHPSLDSIHRVLYFTFGLMVMANCMLNPFLYMFLRDTICVATFLGKLVREVFNPCISFFRKPKDNREKLENVKTRGFN